MKKSTYNAVGGGARQGLLLFQMCVDGVRWRWNGRDWDLLEELQPQAVPEVELDARPKVQPEAEPDAHPEPHERKRQRTDPPAAQQS